MNKTERLTYQKSFRDFCQTNHWFAPHAVTLTMRQGIALPLGVSGTLVALTRENAGQNYRHFLNVLSASVFGQAAKRFGRRLNSISTIEGGEGTRLHIHAAIDCPRKDLIERFPARISEAWRKTQWGHHQIDIQPGADSGWINYISKFRDKPVYADAIDWENYHNADRRV